jgi:hypothetical protein
VWEIFGGIFRSNSDALSNIKSLVLENPEMANFFVKIGKGFEWLGKELFTAAVWVPKIVTIERHVEADAATILPEIGTLIDDAGAVAVAAVKDGSADLATVESLIAAITVAGASKGLNIAQDATVVAAFEAFIKQITTSGNFADVITALKALVLSYEKLGTSVKAVLVQLEKDAA